MSSLMFAARGGHTETVVLLLDRGAEVDKTNRVSVVACIACVEQMLMNQMK